MCVSVCGCEERMSVAESTQQTFLAPNKHCTVEPCVSTDSFYRCHKEQQWKTQDLFSPVGEKWLVISGFKLLQLTCGELGFICVLKVIILFDCVVSTCRRAKFD